MSMMTHSHRSVLLLIAFSGILCSGSGTSVRAYDPAREIPGDATENFDYFTNNWNVIGLKDYVHGSRMTPDNQLVLADKVPVQIRIGPDRRPLSRDNPKRLLHGWMPIVVVTADDGPVRYEITMWATPLPDVKDWQQAFDWPTEGENFLNWIRVQGHQHRRQTVSCERGHRTRGGRRLPRHRRT